MQSSRDATYDIERAGDNRRAGGALRPRDRITLERGLMRLEFPDQVEAVVEGPSRFELRSASEIDLDGGMAWFRVPEAGRGFAVLTERARVIDLGTEFGLRFDTGGTLQVHVARGERFLFCGALDDEEIRKLMDENRPVITKD